MSSKIDAWQELRKERIREFPDFKRHRIYEIFGPEDDATTGCFYKGFNSASLAMPLLAEHRKLSAQISQLYSQLVQTLSNYRDAKVKK